MCVICNIQLGLRVIVRATVEGVWEITEVCIEGDHMGRRVSLSNFYRKRGKKFSRGTGRNVLRDSRRWGGEEGARRRLLMR